LPRTVSISYGGATDRGLKRSDNQDAFGHFPNASLNPDESGGLLFVVADGMGGHRGGREASQMAVDILGREFYKNATEPPDRRLRSAFETVNLEIFERAQGDPDLEGMGTTCTALVIAGDQILIGHVGDSRAYRISDGSIEQLTEDHSYVGEMVRQNLITPERAELHPQRNVLMRAFGARDDVEVDLMTGIEQRPGDRYLLCSDGLTGVPVEVIKETILGGTPQEAAEQLVSIANDAGGHDNVTVQIIELWQVGEE
jgi:protein phosphatase